MHLKPRHLYEQKWWAGLLTASGDVYSWLAIHLLWLLIILSVWGRVSRCIPNTISAASLTPQLWCIYWHGLENLNLETCANICPAPVRFWLIIILWCSQCVTALSKNKLAIVSLFGFILSKPPKPLQTVNTSALLCVPGLNKGNIRAVQPGFQTQCTACHEIITTW